MILVLKGELKHVFLPTFHFYHPPSVPSLSPAGPLRSLAALSQSAVTLLCSNIIADYVLLYWWRPDSPKAQPKRIFQFDRWRNSSELSDPRLQLHGDSSGNFSFLLRAKLNGAGHYQCEVFRDDQVFAQVTAVTILKGNEMYCTLKNAMHDNINGAQIKTFFKHLIDVLKKEKKKKTASVS